MGTNISFGDYFPDEYGSGLSHSAIRFELVLVESAVQKAGIQHSEICINLYHS